VNTLAPLNAPGSSEKATGSIAHATGILLCLSNDIHSLTDIARRCHLSKSTTHRVLKLLERSRLVVEDTINRRYYLGPLLKKLASNPASTHRRLLAAADAEMRRLAELTEETVAMDTFVGIQYVPLREIPSRQDLKVTQESRKAGPPYSGLYAGAAVKVLLSQLDDDKLKTILDHVSIHRETERTVTDKTLLKAQLNEIRQQGYAISRGERVPGVMSISAPVRDYFLPIALSVIGPEIRLQPRAKQVIAELKLSASRISTGGAAISA
jgi:DNA-binding IclR family transcriptional regulator